MMLRLVFCQVVFVVLFAPRLGDAPEAQGAAPGENGPTATTDGTQRPQGSATVSWGSPKIKEIEKVWNREKPTTSDDPKNLQGIQLKLLAELLAGRLSENELKELAASCVSMPVRPRDFTMDDHFRIQALLVALVKIGSRDGLVTLLSTRCPKGVLARQIEFYIVLTGRKKMKDPILVLCDAYTKCRVPEVRQVIAEAIRRGFANAGIDAKEDAEFVKRAVQWYDRNRGHLWFNVLYDHNYSTPGGDYSTNPLFVIGTEPPQYKFESHRPAPEGEQGKKGAGE